MKDHALFVIFEKSAIFCQKKIFFFIVIGGALRVNLLELHSYFSLSKIVPDESLFLTDDWMVCDCGVFWLSLFVMFWLIQPLICLKHLLTSLVWDPCQT